MPPVYWAISTGSCSNLRFASLGSGSRGNATLIEQGDTLLMVDNGFSLRQAVARLNKAGRAPEQVSAILLTHEHADHCAGVENFARKFGTPIWSSHGTRMALGPLSQSIQCFNSHEDFAIDSITITPVAVPHDAREPTQFVFRHDGLKLGVLTDIGSITAHVRQAFSGCDGLLLECNYDPDMLMTGEYPMALKKRVAGDWGHLSNQQAADLLAGLDRSRLRHLILGHLSEKNNQPQLALQAIEQALNGDLPCVEVAQQDTGFAWRDLVHSPEEQASCCN